MPDNTEYVVEGTLHSTGEAGVVRLTARYEAAVENVWEALTEPQRLAGWFGTVSGELRGGGEFAAFVYASEWDGRGRIDECDTRKRLVVTMWEEEGKEHTAEAELDGVGDHTTLQLQVSGVPLEFVWAYGAGWQEHLEDLGSHLAGHSRTPSSSDSRFDEFAASYREMTVIPLEN
jgi:uncharacterized protein YndB with AHSA1/START domain